MRLVALVLASALVFALSGCKQRVACATHEGAPGSAFSCHHRFRDCDDGRVVEVYCDRQGDRSACRCVVDGVNRLSFTDERFCRLVEPEEVAREVAAECRVPLRYGERSGLLPF